MGIDHIKVGDYEVFSKTISESDVYQFAGITGDFCPNHVNEEFCKKSPFGTRIAHGDLTFSLGSTPAAHLAARTGHVCASIGYDRIRFLKPVFFGDTITVVYKVESIDESRMRFTADCSMYNQKKELVLVCKHIQKVFDNKIDSIL